MRGDASFELTFDPDSSTVVIRIVGPVDGTLHRKIFERIDADYDIAATSFLWDLTDTSFSRFSIDEIKTVREVRCRYADARRNVKSCILIRHAYDETLVRLYEELNISVTPRAEVLFDEAAARAYLGIQASFDWPKE